MRLVSVGKPTKPFAVVVGLCQATLLAGLVFSPLFLQPAQASVCGNGTLEEAEECDDGNLVSGDCCDSTCRFEVDGSPCDDANACSLLSTCENGLCVPGPSGSPGDAFLGGCNDGDFCNGIEGCDPITGCLAGTPPPVVCGDGYTCAPEECDDGEQIDGNGCDSNCTVTACGNGIQTSGEECDDGNLADGDGCSSACGCVLTGTWQSGVVQGSLWTTAPSLDLRLTILDDGFGQLTGFSYRTLDPGSTFQTFATTRSDRDFLIGGFPVRLWSCDAIKLLDSPYVFNRVSLSACGNGVLEPEEECDDGNFSNDDSCTILCAPPWCGDKIISAGEECDDGNDTNGDGCTADCTIQECGNGLIEPGEECDDGNRVNGDGCTASCMLQVCGNRVVEPGEECDDGNLVDADGCSSACLLDCPNGITGTWTDGESPSVTLQMSVLEDTAGGLLGLLRTVGGVIAAFPFEGSRQGAIGTFVLEFGSEGLDVSFWLEDCDTMHLYGFPISVVVQRASDTVCGNGILEGEEVCDDGNFVNGDACTVLCAPPGCGDGILELDEECDDGNSVNGDGCTATCTTQVCGNHVVEPGEECDDGNTQDGDGCSGRCTVHTCGDSVVEQGEQCDDGNDLDGDGCSSTCFRECLDLTGTWIDWSFPLQMNLVEREFGNLEGVLVGGIWRLPFTGTRSSVVSGALLTLLVEIDGTTVEFQFRLESCNTIAWEAVRTYWYRTTEEVCGNGILEATEQCDDGNFADGDTCTVLCELRRCGNGIVEAEEECDDGNTVGGDGCSAECREEALPEATMQTAAPGQLVTTDAEGDGATSSDPIETAVTTQRSGSISIEEISGDLSSPVVELSVTQEVRVTVPASTPQEPAEIVFSVDPSRVPVGQRYAAIELFRDGVLVPLCADESGMAYPDPCVARHELLDDGDLQITALMSEGGTWSFGLASRRLLVEGNALSIRDGENPARRRVAITLRDTELASPAPGGLGDPTCQGASGGGATLQLIGAGGSGQHALIQLPCEHWSLTGTPDNPRGYRYRDRRLEAGPCRRAVLRTNSRLRMTCGGRHSTEAIRYDLTDDGEGSVGIILTTGISTSYCANFSGEEAVLRDDAGAFRARNAARPGACPVAR